MLFINPAQTKYGGILNGIVPLMVPVGLGLVAGYLRAKGISVQILDEELKDITPEVLQEYLANEPSPKIVGLSCLTAHVGRGYEIAGMLKKIDPEIRVVFGGLHPTALPDEALDTGSVDFVVKGEGEEVMYQLHRFITNGQDYSDLKGISFIRADGTRAHNFGAPLIPDINLLPMFPYDLFDGMGYEMGFMSSSRGCPMNCTFCSQRMLTGLTYRVKSPEKIVEEIDILVNQYGQKEITFYDDNFCFKKSRVKEVCDAINESGLHEKCDFYLQTRADNFHDDIVPHLKRGGFTMIGFGMEAGNDRLLEVIGKGETVEQHKKAVENCRRHDMDVLLFMIYGLPTETASDREEAFQVSTAWSKGPKFNNLIPYPGTPIFNDLKNSDRVVISKDWTNFNSTLSITSSIFDKTPLPYVPDSTSEFELKRITVRNNLRSYLRLKSVFEILTGSGGSGSFHRLDPRWYLKPKEIAFVFKVGAIVMTNYVIALLPLALTEPIMNFLNPAMKARPRVKEHDKTEYVPSTWDKEIGFSKRRDMKKALVELEETGSFSVMMSAEEKRENTQQVSVGAK